MTPDDKNQKIKFLETLLSYPTEGVYVDYKSAIKFVENDDFALKLVKHVIGFANTQGGHLVIGFKENGQRIPEPDLNLTNDVVGSYESTRLSQYINSHILGTEKVKLTVWKIPFNGVDYPIIEIFQFEQDPFFCSSTKIDSSNKEVLKEGALYMRDSGSKTIQVASPTAWKRLISLSIKIRNDEMLERFKLLINELTSSSQPEDTESASQKINKWVSALEEEIDQVLQTEGFNPDRWEIVHGLIDSKKKWTQDQLLDSARKASLHNTGWPVGVVIYNDNTKPVATEDGVKEILISKKPDPYPSGLDYGSLEKMVNISSRVLLWMKTTRKERGLCFLIPVFGG